MEIKEGWFVLSTLYKLKTIIVHIQVKNKTTLMKIYVKIKECFNNKKTN